MTGTRSNYVAGSDRQEAQALWYVAPCQVELRTERLERPCGTNALVRTRFSAISRGTERLVFQGRIPQSEYERMRAPNQDGHFPFPVKYGYCAAGIVEDGPKDMIGKAFFCLHPHQDRFCISPDALSPIPENVPLARATLAANMETALNAHWDSGSGPCDRIAVVGGGVVGLLVAFLAAGLPGSDVYVIDPNEAREPIAKAFGAKFARPADAPSDCDVVFHASATSEGLATALHCAGLEAAVVELSWYGAKPVAAPLGEAFHSRRLRLVSTQVGRVATSRRPRWDYARRIRAALSLLADDRLDLLISQQIDFPTAPETLSEIFADDAAALAPVIRYT